MQNAKKKKRMIPINIDKKMKIRIANNVDVSKLFSASIRCGSTYNYEFTLETHSNNTFPTIRTIPNFVVIVEPICESKRTIEYKMDDSCFHEQAKDKRGIPTCQTVHKAIIANTGPYKNPNKRILDIAPTLCCNYYSDREPYVIEICETT